MRSLQPQLIDLRAAYPCPRRCRGHLVPIVLTEAMGCSCCQQIFVVAQNGQILERLVHYPYRQSWHWDGRRWFLTRQGWRDRFLPWSLVCVGLLFVLLVLAKSWLSRALLPVVMLALLVAILPSFLIGLGHRSSPLE